MSTTIANAPPELREHWASHVIALFESTPDAMFSVDVNRRLVTYNQSFADNVLHTWGTSVAPGKTAFDLFPPDRAELWTELFSRAFAEGLFHTSLQEPGDRWLEFTLIPIHEDGAIGGVSVFAKDITAQMRSAPDLHDSQQQWHDQDPSPDTSERLRLEAEAAANVRDLRILSDVNSALLRALTENELLEAYCRIVVESGGYLMAWVGFAEDAPGEPIRPVAHFGHELGNFEEAQVAWADSEWGRGPTGRAIRSGQIQYSENISTDPTMELWRDDCLERGYRSVISLPFRPSPAEWACLTAYGSEPLPWSQNERRLLEQVASALGYGVRTLRDTVVKERYQDDLRISLEQTIQVLAGTIHHRDPYTADHQRRVADLSVRIGRRMGLSEERINGLRLAAIIHDLGKVAVPSEILTHPGCLTPLQMALVREHSQLGYEIVKKVPFPWPIAETIRQHHERFDGSGYPQGLIGDKILLEARIITVADVVESMANHRPYRPSRGIDAALQEIIDGSGLRYDPDAVDACVSVFREDKYQLPT